MADDHILSDAELKAALENLPGWEVRDGWLRRKYGTPGWSHTLMLANTIGFLADAAYHHPDLTLGYAELTVKLQTHRVHAITESDTALAAKIDEVVLWKPSAGPLPGYPKKWIH